MKMRRRILSITLLMVLLISISVSASASASLTKMFFRETVSGYTCTGKGGLSGKDIAASFVASENDDQFHVPPEECNCSISVQAFDEDGNSIGKTYMPVLSFYAELSFSTTEAADYVKYTYTFNQHTWTGYTLYN